MYHASFLDVRQSQETLACPSCSDRFNGTVFVPRQRSSLQPLKGNCMAPPENAKNWRCSLNQGRTVWVLTEKQTWWCLIESLRGARTASGKREIRWRALDDAGARAGIAAHWNASQCGRLALNALERIEISRIAIARVAMHSNSLHLCT